MTDPINAVLHLAPPLVFRNRSQIVEAVRSLGRRPAAS